MTDLEKISIEELPLVGPSYAKKLKRLEIETIWDLFHHVPFRFLDFSKNTSIGNLQIGETATIKGEITSYVNQYTKKGKPMQIVTIADETGKVNAIWFNQIYLSKTFKEGTLVAIAGELNWFGRNKAIISPEYEILREGSGQIHTGSLIPIYPETAGISSKWLRRRIFDAWNRYGDNIEEFLSDEILKEYNLENFHDAINKVHFPKSEKDFNDGKNRLAFNELLNLHTTNFQNKSKWQKNEAPKILVKKYKPEIDKFISSLPFSLTNSQETAVKEILSDISKDSPMGRLLEGDVGSGKTVVAAIVMYVCFLNGKKSILMAPTQILANQHANTLKKLFSKTKIKIGLVTSTKKGSSKNDILVGTHALINKKLDHKNIALVVIDEQHKFGVEQRNKLIGKNTPHVLTMTATPIPRTVALTFFGDQDLSVLREIPTGRQKITSWVIGPQKKDAALVWIEEKVKKEKIQGYVVCPLIEESEAETLLEVKAAKKEYEEITKKFPNLKIGLLHGKLKVKEKDKVIDDFKDGKIDLLVTTPVVEVGVDIPNATVMVIEGAQMFGLASLHQLRGRVGRGSKKSYCIMIADKNSEKSDIRLKAMTKNLSGFELSEIDLALRGPGEIYGKAQSGIPELKIADWNNIEMIKITRELAMKLPKLNIKTQ